MRKTLCLVLAVCCGMATGALRAQRRTLTLQETIALACDSTLEAFKSANLYQAGYWQYRAYKAGRLPSVMLNLLPMDYQNSYQKRYDSDSNTDFYSNTRSLAANGFISIEQNIDWLGGKVSVRSGLEFIRNMGSHAFSQFSSTPISIFYEQSLLGFNSIKWEKKIEPLKYEQAKKTYLQNVENIACQATSLFFDLAIAQAEYDMAAQSKLSADTLLAIGRRKFEITAIDIDQMYTLELEQINAANSLKTATQQREQAMHSMVTFLNLDPATELQITLPEADRQRDITSQEALALAKANNPIYLSNQVTLLEARRDVSKAKQQSRFEANFAAGVGFNQTGNSFAGAYRHPDRQEMVQLSVSIPLVDWGVRKGRYRMAQSNLEVAETSSRQSEVSMEKEVITAVNEYNLQQEMMGSTRQAWQLAVRAYEQTRRNYIEGTADINALILANNRKETANRNYLSALKGQWLGYYNIRRLTLHDFWRDMSLSTAFDIDLMNP